MITIKAKKNKPCSQKRTFWRNFQPQLQLQINPKKPDQYDQIQGLTYTKPCSQKMDILAKF